MADETVEQHEPSLGGENVLPIDESVVPAQELAVLISAYELDRADDIQASNAFLTALTVSIGLIGLIGFALLNADEESLPNWMIAMLPLVPVPFAGLAALYVHLAQVRGALLDRYEAELRNRVPKLTASGLHLPAGHTILGRIWVGGYGRAVFALVAIPLGAIYVAVVVESYRIVCRTDPTLARASLGASAAAGLTLGCLFVIAQFPQRVLRKETRRLE